jgi:hypothetical protein
MGKRVERADDVIAVDAEIVREVVARARGNTGVGDVVRGRDLRDNRLRAVTSGDTDRVRSRRDSCRCDRAQIVTGPEHEWFDASRATFAGEVEALRLAAG